MIKGDKSIQFIKIVLKSSIFFMLLLFLCSQKVYAVDTAPTEELKIEWEQRKLLPVDTNLLPNWPQGPLIGAEAAIIMEVETGAILYSKNIDEKLYPASITKMLTSLIVIENCDLNEVVTFSDNAINNTEWGSSRIGIKPGEQLTVEECLYGLLLGSANEVAYGLAEHIGQDLETFVGMMNEKAASMGCLNSHFANASGLPDPNHYVSARDMAIIAREFYKNETLSLISGTYTHTIPETNLVNEKRPLDNHHKMVTGKKYQYEGIVGGKTGFTKDARQTLVTCAQRNGIRLICVVLKDESPNQFLDTADLLDYGFNNFQKLSISENETRYNINSKTFFNTKLDIMGSSKSILTLNKAGYIIIPKTLEFKDAAVGVEYLDDDSEAIAKLIYSIDGNFVGSTTIDYATDVKTFEFAKILTDETDKEPKQFKSDTETIFITVKDVIISILKVLGLLLLVIIIVAAIHSYMKSSKRKELLDKKRYKARSENNRNGKRAYKKRSENRKRKNQVVTKKNGASIYQEMMRRSEGMNKSMGDFDENAPIEFEKDYRNYQSREIDIFEDDDPIW